MKQLHSFTRFTTGARLAVGAALATIALGASARGIHATPVRVTAMFFHAELKRSEPAADSTVTAPPAIKLWFSEKPEIALTRVTLVDATNTESKLGKLAMADEKNAPVVVPVVGTLKPGIYKLTWQTVAKDGHPSKGAFKFHVRNVPM